MIAIGATLVAIVVTGYLYLKWVKDTFAGLTEDLWHEAFDALLNP